ncbi:helicase-related protein [Micrococcus luteus]|uniref:helicase-related protein n=1 Tax=Micrococcus luteus TaxID=1270 RepID=UPI00100975AC|nr:helicase-related protein [Micrococcus luteus]QAV28836.1 helicase [Micrococcus luteus]
MSLRDEHYILRETLIENLERDLVGPQEPDEVLDPVDRPLNRYISGVLWPQPSTPTTADGPDPERLEDEPEDESQRDELQADPAVSASRMRAPSACGFTFTVDPGRAGRLRVTAAGARYVPAQTDETAPPGMPTGSAEAGRAWRRETPAIEDVFLDASEAPIAAEWRVHELVGGSLHLHTLVRPADEHGLVTITVTLVNPQRRDPQEDADSLAWFQTGIAVTADAPCIVDRGSYAEHVPEDLDLRSSALLYRDVLSFAAGHGCAVEWSRPANGEKTTESVWTTWVPRQEVGRAKPGSSTARMDFQIFVDGSRAEVGRELQLLVDEYRSWIEERRLAVETTVPGHLVSAAGENLAECTVAADRMDAGVALLLEDDMAFEAFRLANRAMHMQRSRQDWVRRGSVGQFKLEPQSWRPFQIAFILINLPSLTDRAHPEREISDLLWFPAGGGKTEAYLGLIAYLIFLRRLRDPETTGVAVLMRYTLRLLTAQQFERAAMLICSLEQVRRQDPDLLGYREFGIGLWVGKASTPNTMDDARKKLRQLLGGYEVEESNPVQLRACPWCGARLGEEDYSVSRPSADPRMTVRCPSGDCMFHFGAGLPVHIVDEEVYDVRPELVIGTVDKFAMTAWTPSSAALFGRAHASDIGPDLIIQDELHLISGPLGSTVGIYETAIDWAAGRATEDGRYHRPKVVTSTATIRRAPQQIRAVFDRESKLFPPPGLDLDRSFFAEPATRDQAGTREYVGVLAPGISQATLMVRTYASLLHTVATTDLRDEVKDPYWTLIGYFNSLRVLGSAYLQVSDDIESGRLPLLAQRDGVEPRSALVFEELTSRVPSSEIPRTLKNLEVPLGDSAARPLDLVLATNMISVGLDVDRLGLMAVMGQPPSSAEYIQATSRVGRKHPGLVVTIYNASKSRDRSHYESFAAYHSSLYQAVEASSATPFAPRSRDRSLAGTLVSGIRMTDPQLRADDSAGDFSPGAASVKAFQAEILRRVESVTHGDEGTVNDTRSELNDLLDEWARRTGSLGGVSHYSTRPSRHGRLGVDGLMTAAGQGDEPGDDEPDTSPWTVPWPVSKSMRDVDAETALNTKGVREPVTRRQNTDEEAES